jgi:hypothetical protein
MVELTEVFGEGKRPLESMARAIGPAQFDPLARAIGPYAPPRALPPRPPPHRHLPRVAPAARSAPPWVPASL